MTRVRAGAAGDEIDDVLPGVGNVGDAAAAGGA